MKKGGGGGRTRICNDIVYLDGDLLIHRLRGPPSPLEKAIGGEGGARGDGSAAEKANFFVLELLFDDIYIYIKLGVDRNFRAWYNIFNYYYPIFCAFAKLIRI